jgi:hypothetical protein
MYKSLLVIFLLFFCSFAANAQNINVSANGEIVTDTVCQGTSINLESTYTHDNIKQFNWSINGKHIYNTSSYTLNNSDFIGTLTVVSEVIYIEKKYRKVGKKLELCEVVCHAWNSRIIEVLPCKSSTRRRIVTCPSIPVVSIKGSTEYTNNPIPLEAEVVFPDGYTVEWVSSSGKLITTGSNTALLYPDLASEISVIVAVKTSYPECNAQSKVTLTILSPKPSEKVLITTCDLKSTRIDNACKVKLHDAIGIFQQNAGKSLTIQYSNYKVATEAFKVLTNGTLGVKLDSYRVIYEYKPLLLNRLNFVIKY